MSSNRLSVSPAELLRRWRGLVVPVEDPEHAAAWRARLVDSIASHIRSVSQQRRGQRLRRRVVAAVAMAAAAIAIVGGWRWVASSSTAAQQAASQQAHEAPVRLQTLAGTVVAKVASREQIVGAAAPVSLRDGDEISTAPGGRAAVELSGKAWVELSSATRLRIVRTKLSAQRLTLRSGRIEVSIPEHAAAQKLVVETPDAEVIALGTRFSVKLVQLADSKATATVVNVSRGKVRVIRRGGKSASLRAGQRWASEPGVDQLSEECAGAEESSSGPSDSRLAGGARSTKRAGAGVSPAARSQLAQQNRLYRAALDARNAGRDAQARRLLDQFLARYPESPLAQEAQVERFRLLERMGRHSEAARQARRYLAEHDSGFAREEARELILSPK